MGYPVPRTATAQFTPGKPPLVKTIAIAPTVLLTHGIMVGGVPVWITSITFNITEFITTELRHSTVFAIFRRDVMGRWLRRCFSL